MKRKANYLSILFAFVFFYSIKAQQSTEINPKDTASLHVLIEIAKDKNNDRTTRKANADKASNLVFNVTTDSLRNQYFLDLSLAYSKIKDSINFRRFNTLSTNLSIQLKDSIGLANNYWDIGSMYKFNNKKDSAYYFYIRSQRIFEKLNDSMQNADMLFRIAKVQMDMSDFTGAEITITEAIKIYKDLKNEDRVSGCYNLLGLIFEELEEYDTSIYYFNQFLNYAEQKGHMEDVKAAQNNLGNVYIKMENYSKAIYNYKKILSEYDSLKVKDSRDYARVLDNLAYSRLKNKDTLGVFHQLKEAFHIRDSMQNIAGISLSKLRLAEYYLYKGDTASAIKETKESLSFSNQIDNMRDKLSALQLLGTLEKNPVYYREYIHISDSLQKDERRLRNKAARIRLETDEFKERTEVLAKQKKNISIAAISALGMGLLLFIIWSQRVRNKKLQLEQAQQKANEEIYNLMLDRQYSVEEGRKAEKRRISAELHDGVLGKLFGTRLILGTLNKAEDSESIEKREKYISDLQEIEEEIRNVSHELHDESRLSDIGYGSMIEELLERQSAISNFEYTFTFDEKVRIEKFSAQLKMNLYRILQEAIQNINKYAKASKVSITMKIINAMLEVIVQDNGIGFDVSSWSKGIGLKNMESRVADLHGTFNIESTKDEGTTIRINIPL